MSDVTNSDVPVAPVVQAPADSTPVDISVPATISAVDPAPATTPKTSINVHPKVFAGFLTGLGVTIAGGIAAYVTPDSLAFLGPWAVPAAGLVGTGLTLLVSWLKKSEPKS